MIGLGHRRPPDLPRRVTAVESALAHADGRLDPEATARARAVLNRTDERLRLGGDLTVVALAGATGSGKSSLFNALAGMDISEVGTRRPTTGKPTACVWNGADPDRLLDWLEVPRRHRMARESVLDADREASLHGLLLLDLPDHDSTEIAHRLEVDRLVGLVDLLVWVVDPQKYADEALHIGYLRRLSAHAGVMLVVLNQIDRLAPGEVETCRRDLRRLLDTDGLGSVRLLVASARRGDGIEELRRVLAEVVSRREAVVRRAVADLDTIGRELATGLGDTEADPAALPGTEVLVAALAQAAGVPVVLTAVENDYRRRATAATGWPFTRWLRRLRPDPLRRLRLGEVDDDLRRLTRSSLPEPTPAQRARVELAVHEVVGAATEGLPPRWSDAVRTAVVPPGADLSDALDTAVVGVDLARPDPTWWQVFRGLQLLGAVAAVGGLCWLVVLAALDWLRLPTVEPPAVGVLPVPTLLLLGGLVGGLVLAWVTGRCARIGARRRRRRLAHRLTTAIRRVADERILAPVTKVLADHRQAREALTGKASAGKALAWKAPAREAPAGKG